MHKDLKKLALQEWFPNRDPPDQMFINENPHHPWTWVADADGTVVHEHHEDPSLGPIAPENWWTLQISMASGL